MTDAGAARRILAARLQSLSPSHLRITDESRAHRGHREAGAGAHFRLEIASPRFAGESALSRHRMVFAAAGDIAAAGIHALSIRASAPGEISDLSISRQEHQQ